MTPTVERHQPLRSWETPTLTHPEAAEGRPIPKYDPSTKAGQPQAIHTSEELYTIPRSYTQFRSAIHNSRDPAIHNSAEPLAAVGDTRNHRAARDAPPGGVRGPRKPHVRLPGLPGGRPASPEAACSAAGPRRGVHLYTIRVTYTQFRAELYTIRPSYTQFDLYTIPLTYTQFARRPAGARDERGLSPRSRRKRRAPRRPRRRIGRRIGAASPPGGASDFRPGAAGAPAARAPRYGSSVLRPSSGMAPTAAAAGAPTAASP